MGSVTTKMRRTRWAAAAATLILLLVAAGCASASGEAAPTGDVDGATGPTPPGVESQGTPDGQGEANGQGGAGASVDPNDPLGFGEEANTAVVVIGDERYEFSDLYCVTMGGALSATSVGGEPSVRIDLPPAGWETDTRSDWSPPSVEVDLEDGTDWVADPESTALFGMEDPTGRTGVDSYETDGDQASGTATFMDASAWATSQVEDGAEEPEPVQGTFEVSCAGG